MALVRDNLTTIVALVGVIELFGALGCLICALMFGNVTNTTINEGQLYSKYYNSASATRRYASNGGTYWWAGLPFLLPGMIGLYAFATKTIKAMIVFMVANIISFFSGIALAIFVGLFYNLWKVPMTAYQKGDCVFEYHEQSFKTFCQCSINSKSDVTLMDADRMWIFVQGCDEVETINIMLITIIALSIITAIIAFSCSYIACYAIRFPAKPVNQPRKGFNPPPSDFLMSQQDDQKPNAAPQARQDYQQKQKAYGEQEELRSNERQEQPRSYDRQEKPRSYDRQEQPKSYAKQEQPKSFAKQEQPKSYAKQEQPRSYKDQYASQFPPPYQDAKAREAEEDDVGDGWL